MSKLRQIVDRDDQLIANKLKTDIDFKNEIYRVAALWLTSPRGDILIAQRSLDNSNGAGEWGPAVAGTVEKGETYESNIYKEAEEEIGLKDITFQTGPKTFHGGERNYFCQWYKATISEKEPADFDIQTSEVNTVAWVPKADLLKDVSENPEKYVPGFGDVLGQLA